MTAAEDAPQTRARILVADEPASLEKAKQLLGERFDVLVAASVDQALELLDEHGDVAVLLADYRLGATRGSELLARAREARPRTRRMLSLSEVEISILVEAINDGRVDRVVRKPWEDDLSTAIAELADEFERSRGEQDAMALLESQSRERGLREHELKRQLDETRRALRSAGEELAQLTRELEVLSFRDPLTGLYNHRAFQERLYEEMARAQRYEQPLSLILCDLDNFGQINSRLGYQIGDETLRRLATAVFMPSAQLPNRKSDVAARFGGELFALVLPETAKAGATIKAERMRELVVELPAAEDIQLSVSVGIATFPDDASEPESLLRAAKLALRVAKKNGKNQVAVYGDERAHNEVDDDEEDEEVQTSPPSRPILGSGPPMFPSYHQRLGEIVAALERDQAVAALYVDLSRLRRVEQEYGLARHATLFAKAGTLLHSLQGTKLRRDDLICRTEVDDAYICVLSPARHKGSGVSLDLGAIGRRVEAILDAELGKDLAELGTDRPRITVGYARVLNNPLMRAERLIARLVEEARQSAEMLRDRTIYRDKAQLQELILHRQLVAVYQPIVHLDSGDTFGFESLTRGPADTRLEMPIELFAIADEVDLTFELDRACFRGALRAAVGLEPVHRLFVNVLPLSFYDANFIEHEVARLLEEANLTPANLVFEITERLAIENFSAFRKALARYTAMGFGVAIDDVGTRHSNLETVMALRPHFIKVSDILTRDISGSTVKREMMRSLGRIAEAIDAVIVAEGIETPDDLAVLSDLGVHYGQGYFLARPGPPFPIVSRGIKDTVRALAKGRRSPIPAPELDFDDDGDYRDAEGDEAVRNAVIRRIQQVPGHEEAKSMLERLERLRTDEPMSAPAFPRGTLPPSTLPDDPDFERQDTGMHRMERQFLEWAPISEEDLGGDSSTAEAQPSLLDGLRQRRGEAEPATPKTTDSRKVDEPGES